MAKKVTVTLIDDLDRESEAVETVEFGLDGVSYEIDLSEENAENLREQLRDWISHSRKASGRRRGQRVSSAPRTTNNREETAAIRRWARENGFKVSSRGRIPGEVLEAYGKAH